MEISKPDFKTDAIHEELVRKYWRVIKLARTPTREEFTKIAIVAAAGVIVVGMIGFAIFVFFNIESLFGF
jgi:protein transport protein SEC61 subunit gamma-like protein